MFVVAPAQAAHHPVLHHLLALQDYVYLHAIFIMFLKLLVVLETPVERVCVLLQAVEQYVVLLQIIYSYI